MPAIRTTPIGFSAVISWTNSVSRFIQAIKFILFACTFRIAGMARSYIHNQPPDWVTTHTTTSIPATNHLKYAGKIPVWNDRNICTRYPVPFCPR